MLDLHLLIPESGRLSATSDSTSYPKTIYAGASEQTFAATCSPEFQMRIVTKPWGFCKLVRNKSEMADIN